MLSSGGRCNRLVTARTPHGYRGHGAVTVTYHCQGICYRGRTRSLGETSARPKATGGKMPPSLTGWRGTKDPESVTFSAPLRHFNSPDSGGNSLQKSEQKPKSVHSSAEVPAVFRPAPPRIPLRVRVHAPAPTDSAPASFLLAPSKMIKSPMFVSSPMNCAVTSRLRQ